ncbi:hypothetical protein PH213_43425 [Streptomyces sp. SRF1]|uniref:hypothetical protein n=1 Tax=Streptomyces sp. SRF1 TaxID=1549642 RepID=UPI0025B10B9B|nr:hypothetical protein [Streptomyces sp. SRF1]MDN3061228.1 hypothetical protein [Streptomyces sp. SRF1]
MSIQPVESSQYLTANREWLASLHGTDQTETITLDLRAPFAPGQTRVPAALLWHGAVKASKVPGGIDLSQLTWHPRAALIRFV